MKTTFTIVLLAFLALSPARASALDDELAAFSRRYQDAQPSERQLAIWKLDWEDQLATALARARKERRPVLFIHVTNVTGPSNFGSGHC